jgi:hypothetical protein
VLPVLYRAVVFRTAHGMKLHESRMARMVTR